MVNLFVCVYMYVMYSSVCLCMDEYMCVRVPLNRLNDLQLVQMSGQYDMPMYMY